ncbi:MAG TPA: hypothetical protein VMW72_14070 [Sedimentisphaerales bacterium]|nr:hypothetical protein [Sedimentisphaerales bacterium]
MDTPAVAEAVADKRCWMLDARNCPFDPFGHAQGRLCSGQVSQE